MQCVRIQCKNDCTGLFDNREIYRNSYHHNNFDIEMCFLIRSEKMYF